MLGKIKAQLVQHIQSLPCINGGGMGKIVNTTEQHIEIRIRTAAILIYSCYKKITVA